jgi:hypothetical protein
MPKNGIGIAAVLLNESRLRSAKTYGAAIQQQLPGVRISIVESTDQVRVLKVDGSDVYFAMMPPFPWSDLESLTKNSWHWKESGALLRAHKAHILVTLMEGPEDPIEYAMLFSKLTAAVLTSQECVGVYWHGPAISPAKMFLESVKEAGEGGPYPLLSWVSFALVPEPSGLSVVSQGMNQLGHKEMELIADRGDGDVVEYTLTLCDYVLKKGPILRHGETIGRTASEKFPIIHRPWRWDKTKDAIEIDMRKGARKSQGILGRLFGK